jgi:arsenate reductase-like glutaredoxin family protein
MKTLCEEQRETAERSEAKLSAEALPTAELPAWVSSMGMEWLYLFLQKNEAFAKLKTDR